LINRVANGFAQIYIGAALRKQSIEIELPGFSGQVPKAIINSAVI
jgi:hypothetical protein